MIYYNMLNRNIMNRILLLLCIFMAFSCSKSENDDVSPEDIPDNSIASLYKRVRLATKDTVGLNIMSHCTNSHGDACKEGYLFTGIKQGKLDISRKNNRPMVNWILRKLHHILPNTITI